MEAIFFKFRRFFQGFGVCFSTDAFDTDTFQHRSQVGFGFVFTAVSD